ARLGAPVIEPLLEALKETKSAVVKTGAAQTLGLLVDERGLPALLTLLKDESAAVRLAAAKAFKRVSVASHCSLRGCNRLYMTRARPCANRYCACSNSMALSRKTKARSSGCSNASHGANEPRWKARII
ncbi:HEAT repeat domain-containing protein, partial [bacterium]|nr:HEAT repeat domain-containing protein [bacterium]